MQTYGSYGTLGIVWAFFGGSFYYKGAVLYWGPKRGPEFRELPVS